MSPDPSSSPSVTAAWPPIRVFVTGICLAAGLAAGVVGFTRWPELPRPAVDAGLQRHWVTGDNLVRMWRVLAGDPTGFARPDAPGFSEAVRARRPVATYQVTEYQPPVQWLDSGVAGERVGPAPAVAEPATAHRWEPMIRFDGETLPEPLAASSPLVYPHGLLWEWRTDGALPAFPSVPATATLTGPTQIELAAGPSGTVVVRRLAHSCGDPMVDQLALERCRSIRFITPDDSALPLLDAQGPLLWGDLVIHWTVAPAPGG
jgi:hypothetical protein